MDAPGFGITLLARMQGEVTESRTGQRLAGSRLRDAVAACAYSFRKAAEPTPGPVLLALDLSLESTLAYLGALASGRTVVPVDVKEWQQKGGELIKLLQPAICWFPSRIAPVHTQVIKHALYGLPTTSTAAACDVDSYLGLVNSNPDTLVAGARVMVPTSGSMGRPSFVRVSDSNLITNTSDIVDSQKLTGEDKSLLCLPLNYCFGASVLHSHLWVGGSVVIEDRMMFPEKVLDTLELEQCTTFSGVPTSFLFLQTRSSILRRNFPSLRLWLQAGGYLSASVVNAFRETHPNTDFAVMYGQTEATARIAAFNVDGDYPYGCVGYPMASLQVEIRNVDGTAICPGMEGDVWIRGASICAGYYGDPDREADKFVHGWLNTGDIGHLLEDGRLCITGRADGFIKVRGRRISSHEIEDLILRELGVHCCACAIPDSSSGEVIGLLLESSDLSGGRDPSVAPGKEPTSLTHAGTESLLQTEWSERVRRALPQHWDLGPVMCGELPLTSNGKINRRACLMLLTQEGKTTCR